MNKQIGRLFGLLLVLFGVLIVATSWWTVFGAKGLTDNSANRRPLLQEQRVPRGKILARDGTELAISQRHGKGNSLRYVREYPTSSLFAHAVGYSFITQGRAALERKYNDPLTGNANEFKSIIEQLTNKTRQGEDLHTTLDPQAQRTAIQALGGQKGAVVALEPDTGRVRVMASVPSFDPNLIPTQLPRLNRDTQNTPLVNRATQSQYPPGSTFKVVTAAAAIDSGKYNPDSILDGHSPRVISGTPLSNFGGENFGPISLTDALTNSVNTVWAQVGESLGRGTLEKYMDRFGFNRRPPIDYPSSQLTASGVYSGGKVVGSEQQFDVGRVAIGEGGAEGQILVTPLQMAMVAAAVGNKGELMRPRLAEKIVDKDGRVKESFDPEKVDRVISEKSAGELAQMMANVVKEGTGTASALQGIQVAGKTGTAQVAGNTANQAWFIAFAPVDNPKMAIAVTVERTQGTGGEVAAPIAKQMLQSLIGG